MDQINSSFITLIYYSAMQAMIYSAEDPTLQGKLYHTFEMEVNQEGNRVFEKANSGLVFESFYLLDEQSAPLIGIVASDASHQGNMIEINTTYYNLSLPVIRHY
jgi:hypothetical protein